MLTARLPDLDGASVFITGGGSGIGAALTEGFLRQGAKVAFCQRSDASAFVEEMESATGNRPVCLQCDVTDTTRLKAVVAEAGERHGTLRVLVNNAANDQRHETMTTDEAFWDWSQAINLKSYFFASQAALEQMIPAGRGSIVNFSSISYMMGNGGYPAYTAANAGIVGLTRSLARDHGRQGVRVNAVAPGWILTEKQLEMWASEESLAAHQSRMCLDRHLGPADLAGPVLFLASELSAGMTGQTIAVDGGVVTVAA